MLCEKCQQREATVLYTEIIGGVKKEQHLCEECAAKFTSFKVTKPENSGELTLGDLLSSIFDTYYPENTQKEKNETDFECSACHTTYDEFLKSGRLGCAHCYENFEPLLGKTLKSIQGADLHTGKRPIGEVASAKNILDEMPKIDRLGFELQAAIESEEYEEAARIRDEIRALKGET